MSVTDMSKITLENIDYYEDTTKKGRKKLKLIKSEKHKKEYQHNYWLNVTKEKRKLEKEK